MDYNFLIVLFKNKVKKRIIKKFVSKVNAESFYSKLIKENENVIFNKEYDSGNLCTYELGLIELGGNQDYPVYLSDELGRNIKVKFDEEGMVLCRISNYKVEEKLFDLQINKKIDLEFFIKNYINKDGVKLVSTLNNKIIVQRNEVVSLFSLKNVKESYRFIDSLTQFFMSIKKTDCIFVKDFSSSQRKYLFEILEKNGIDKKILYRKFTTYPRSK